MIVGTAGHIDHGKTALVKALTGVDADRLKEEKARGITIDLGYAYSDLGDGRQLGFVDVPGHERFVHNMLAGATGIDAALLIVSAAEGIKPQTVEHLQIMDLLGTVNRVCGYDVSDQSLLARSFFSGDDDCFSYEIMSTKRRLDFACLDSETRTRPGTRITARSYRRGRGYTPWGPNVPPANRMFRTTVANKWKATST